MTVRWADLALTAMLVAAGIAVSYAVLRRRLQAAADEQQHGLEGQLSALAATVKALESRVEELSRPQEMEAAAVAAEFTMASVPETAFEPVPVVEQPVEEGPIDRMDDEVTPETMAVITAAVTQFLGKKVRILSAKRLPAPRQGLSAWSQQGRVFVQASHNLRMN